MNRGLANGVFCLVGLLTACANVDSQRSALSVPSASCCSTVSKERALALPGSGIKLEVSEATPPVAFPTGNSYYRVVDLGEPSSRPAHISVRPVRQITNVYASGGSWAPVFFAAVTFLTEDRQYISTVQQSSAGLPPANCVSDSHCDIGVLTAAVPNGARYAVIHTPTSRVGVTQITPLPGQTPGQTYMIGKSFVTLGAGATPVVRTIGMSTGQVEVVPLN